MFRNYKKVFETEYLKINDITRNEFDGKYNKKLFKTFYLSFLSSIGIDNTLRYGYKYFYNDKFIIKRGVFVPQSDTEVIFDFDIEGEKGLEVGSGTGVISITLEKHFSKNMESIDINKKAIKLSKKNNADISTDVKFIYGNIFGYDFKKKFDFVISNPPYITKGDSKVSGWVKRNQPSNALYENESIEFYKYLIDNFDSLLNDFGHMYFELGIDSVEPVVSYLDKMESFSFELIRDYNNIERHIKIWKTQK